MVLSVDCTCSFHALQVCATDESAAIKGYLQRWHKGKKWKKQWMLIKDKVLFTFKATQVYCKSF